MLVWHKAIWKNTTWREKIRIYLVRHGQTDWNQVRRIQGGGSDISLNKNGRAQAKRLAGYFRDKSIEAVYSSPLKRALATARVIAYYHNLDIVIERDLREIDAGELEGILLETLTDDLSSYLISWEQGNGAEKLPGGESLLDLRRRAWDKTVEILARHEGSAIIVSHYFVILSAIGAALDMPITYIKMMRLKPASISILDFIQGKAMLSVFNDTCHLENGS